MTPDRDETLWLIDRYLRNGLSEEARNWVDQAIDSDSRFREQYESYLVTLGSVGRVFYHDKIDADLKEYNENIFLKRKDRSSRVRKSKREFSRPRVRYLSELIGIKRIVAALVLVGAAAVGLLLFKQRPSIKYASIEVTGAGRGFAGGNDSVPVLIYPDRFPFVFVGDSYKWPADTLRVYSSRLLKEGASLWTVQADETDRFFLLTEKDIYTINRKIEEITPLVKYQIDE